MTVLEQPTYRGKSHDQLSAEEWTKVREIDRALYDKLIEASWQKPKAVAEPKAPAPVAQEVRAINVRVSPKYTLPAVINMIAERIGDLIDAHNKFISERWNVVTPELKGRIEKLESKTAGAASAEVVAQLMTRVVELEKRMSLCEHNDSGHRSHLAQLEKKFGELHRDVRGPR